MRIEYLREFVTLGHTCSFNATAKLHYISEATLSKHIASIEAVIGAKLLIRDTHHVRLSEVGREFLQDVESLVEEYDYALGKAKALAVSTHLIRVGYLQDALGGLLPKALKWMTEHHPELNVQLTSADFNVLSTGLVSRKYNLVLTMDIDEELNRRCDFLKLRDDVLCACVSPDHPFADRSMVDAGELGMCPLLMPDASQMAPMHHRVLQIVGRSLEECTIARVCYDMSSVILLAESGVGVGIVPRFQERQYRDRVRFIPLEGSAATHFNLGALWLRGRGENLVAPMVEALEHASRKKSGWRAEG